MTTQVRYEQSLIDKKQAFNRLALLVGSTIPQPLEAVDLNARWFKGGMIKTALPSALYSAAVHGFRWFCRR